MKKAILLAAMFGTIGATNAQELRSKRGEYILPEAGDYAIGIDATPFLNYVGNFFGKSANNNAPNWNYLTRNQTITGKYFATPNMAYRGTVRLGFGSEKEKYSVAQRGTSTVPTYPALPALVENSYASSYYNIGLAAGFEKRRGFTRLQGFYGAEVGLNVSGGASKYTYGNALTNNTVTNPVDVDIDDEMNGGVNITSDTYGNDARVTKVKNGTSVEFGVRGFVGAEYFVMPKISIAGEFGWGLGIQAVGKSSYTMESVGMAGSTSTVGTQTIETPGATGFRFDTDNRNSILGPSGSIRLNLHF